jgi:hypothetical protein
VVEGDTGAVSAQLRVEMDQEPATGEVRVAWTTRDGTAEAANGDYEAASGEVVFTLGSGLSQTIDVQVHGDETIEHDEQFLVRLESATSVELVDGEGAIIIANDDYYALAVNDASAREGDEATVSIGFEISVVPPVGDGHEVSLAWQTAPLSATSGDDYSPVAATEVFLTAGESSATVTVDVVGDLDVEDDEGFLVRISQPSALAEIVDEEGLGTIQDDDCYRITVADVRQQEGDLGATELELAVVVSPPVAFEHVVTVEWSTNDGTARSGVDYAGVAGQQLSFGEGEALESVWLQVNADEQIEPDEVFYVQLGNASPNAVISSPQAVVTIQNDDFYEISMSDARRLEGDDDTALVALTLSVTPTVLAGHEVALQWSTADDTALAGSDYTAVAGETLTFSPGQSFRQIHVQLHGDLVAEPNERLLVQLASSLSFVRVLDAEASVFIDNDDWRQSTVDLLAGSATQVNALVAYDDDHDGRADLYTADVNSDRVKEWSLDTESGDIVLVSATAALPNDPHGLVVGDFNDNGHADAVIAVRYSGVFLCLWSTDSEDWAECVNVTAAGSNSYGHGVTGPYDLNSDGHLDFIADQDKDQVIYYGNGDGTFLADINPIGCDADSPAGDPMMPVSGRLLAIDIDGDEALDLVGAWAQGGWSYYSSDRQDYFLRGFLNLGDDDADGALTWGVASSEVLGHKTGDRLGSGYALQVHSSCVVASDFDEDGLTDLVVADYSNGRVLLAQAESTGQDWVESELLSSYGLLETADLNGDGHVDIISGANVEHHANASEGLELLYGRGDGTFEHKHIALGHQTMAGRSGAAVGDFDGDGYLDIAAGRYDAVAAEWDGAFVLLQGAAPGP